MATRSYSGLDIPRQLLLEGGCLPTLDDNASVRIAFVGENVGVFLGDTGSASCSKRGLRYLPEVL